MRGAGLTIMLSGALGILAISCADKASGDGSNTDGSGDGNGTETCPVGSEGCPCTAGGACDAGLMCLSNICVDAEDGTGSTSTDNVGTGSTGSTSSGGTTDNGDTTGTGDSGTSATTTSHTTSTTTDATGTGSATGDIYASFDGSLVWSEARTDCITRGGDLADIPSAVHNDVVLEICMQTPGGPGTDYGCWIGLEQPFNNWTNGNGVTYTNWAPGRPDGNGPVVWIYKQAGNADPGDWDDYVTDWYASYVCRLPSDGDTADATAIVPVP